MLFLAHREELLTQARDKIRAVTGLDSVLEKAESTSLWSAAPVTVGSMQTLCRANRLKRFAPGRFSAIIVDEAHHVLSDSYRSIFRHFADTKVLGITATPFRADHKDLGEFFDSLAYEYSLTAAIRDGHLAPIRAQMIPLTLDISSVGVSHGDYIAGELGSALEPYLEQIAGEMAHYCAGRRTVVFLPLVATSKKFCEILRGHGLRAVEVNGESPNRAEILADFEAGKYEVLCNSALLFEGWDCPPVDCVVMLRPTRSRGTYAQAIGRGTRPYPGKEYLLLLDFLWLSERHDLCRPSSLVCKDTATAAKVDDMLAGDNAEHDLIDAESAAERDVLAEREDALARELTMMRRRKRQLVDPIQYALSIAAEDLANYTPTFAWEMAPPSEKQLEFLERRGIFALSVRNAGVASMIIDRLKRRQEEGLSTPKQIRLLERYGFRQVGTWRFDDASAMISRIAARNWSLPYGFDPERYRPLGNIDKNNE